jgi:release factor glutamine methyltransferase
MTCGEALADLTVKLRNAGITSARLDARLLVGHVLGVSAAAVFSHPEWSLAAEDEEQLRRAAARRLRREPMSHILGCREFWSLRFKVTPDTLDPRPDSETVVEAALSTIADRQASLRLLDFGTGTGCLLLAMLSELPQATGVGIDASPRALVVARENARTLGLHRRAGFVLGNWGTGIDQSFDVILANPPYIPDLDIAGLEAEVALFEPVEALAGGADGLESYRQLAPDVARLLSPNGVAILEVGAGQAAAVTRIFEAQELALLAVRRDLAGVERCVLLSRPTA